MHLSVRPVVDDLTAGQVGVAVKHLGWLRVALHAPVEHSVVRYHADGVDVDPFPEVDLLGQVVGLHLALHLNVEDLESAASCSKKTKLQV